ncbi:hypothetical protein J4467_00750 [Candidatus Woesearchaeota archaeon]|nr:hypothetical protein [Candidatus Woesearchaeota archaeon]
MANYSFDMLWALRYLDDLEKFVDGSQLFMAKATIQRVKETLETYGRQGFESNFEKIRLIENALESGQDPKDTIISLKLDINKRMKI